MTTPTVWEQETARIRSSSFNPLKPVFKGFANPDIDLDLPKSILIELGTTKEVYLSGENFTPEAKVGFVLHTETAVDKSAIGLTESTYDVSTNKLIISLPASAGVGWFDTSTAGVFDLVIDVDKNIWEVYDSAIEIKPIPWIDLRAGGETFTASELTYATRLTVNRDAEGMWFSGDTGWDTWAYFKKLEHPRSQPKQYEWIFKHTAGSQMIGIAGASANAATTTAYYEAEIVAYFTSQTNFNRFYGDRTSGGDGAVVTADAIKKLVLEHNGEGGHKYCIYEIPSADPADWEDISNLKATGIIPSIFNQSDNLIAPYFACNTSNHRLIAVKLK